MASKACNGINIMWFRHGLRIHDNPALLKALGNDDDGLALLPLFIFDGESADTKYIGYNRTRFLLDSLKDLDEEFNKYGGKLYIFQGSPVQVFRKLHNWIPVRKICFEENCEPIWQTRDNAVREMCYELGIMCIEEVSHTLWNPRDVINTNRSIPPLTYEMFLHTVQIIGLPPKPAPYPDWKGVIFINLPNEMQRELQCFEKFPTAEDLNVFPESSNIVTNIWKGGEKEALFLLKERLKVEENSFQNGYYMPNQCNPNILESPKSMSAHLRCGCLSVRRFYWAVHDLFNNVQLKCQGNTLSMIGGAHITGQLIWREYFYTMSVNNINYDRLENNDICLKIPWKPFSETTFQQWVMGKTGYPLIDGAMRQLLAEGWIHHTLRNVTATFLTRGGLWLSWEHGLQHFLKYLIDADWSVCAGNWMWVSSSAFENLLDSSVVTCPVALAKRLDPNGEYVRKYISELRNVPTTYIHEPWRMPLEIQQACGCVIGVDYPERIIDLDITSKRNNAAMKKLRNDLIRAGAPSEIPPHCRPSNEEEIRHFFWLID